MTVLLSDSGGLMRTLAMSASVAALALIGACSRTDSKPDDALKNDLALAAQTQPYQAQQFVSPSEQQYNATAPQLAGGTATAPTMRSPAPVSRAPARRTASRSRSSSGGYYPAPAPAPRPVVKHTGRDAAIGAGAGAVIGAVTSRDKLKGGIIGAAAGGILGAVIGNNVDIKRP
ncbi:MAG TPA: YMGG-like glycine zipper-containing protein [Gemmatimonadaceae bacterium]